MADRHRLPDEELPGTAAAAGGDHCRPGAGDDQAVGCADARLAPARPARHQGRRDLVDRAVSNVLGRIDPKTGAIREYTLKTPHTGPHGLTEDKDGNIWFTGNVAGFIGKLDPKTGIITEYKMPDPTAKDPHTLIFDHDGILWFTVQQANMVGRLDPKTGESSWSPRRRRIAALWHGGEFQERRAFRRVRRQQDRHHRRQDHGDQGISLPDPARGRAASRSRPTTSSGTRISRAASSAGSTPRPARSTNGRRPAGRSRSPTASSSPRARSGTTNPSPSRTPSCASIPRPRSSRPGRSPAAATSCATWT